MRPAPQSHFRYPLTGLLGTEAGVRVLRELALHGDELTTTALARRTGVTDQSVRNVVATLHRARVLKTYGQGRAAAYQLDPSHPVARMLVTLFREEDRRLRAIYDRIRSAAKGLDPQPLAVWMYGSVARHEDGMESDLDLLLIVEDSALAERVADAFREELQPLEQEQRLTISVVPLSRDDVLRLAGSDDSFWRALVADAVCLHGPHPEGVVSRFRRRDDPAVAETAHG